MCGIFEFSDFAKKMWKKIRFKFEISEKFYKGFPWKKKFPRESFVKWTHVKIKGNSFVNFSVGGPRSIYKGIPLKLKKKIFTKDFPVKKNSMEFYINEPKKIKMGRNKKYKKEKKKKKY